jgi:hypothetical protein
MRGGSCPEKMLVKFHNQGKLSSPLLSAMAGPATAAKALEAKTVAWPAQSGRVIRS